MTRVKYVDFWPSFQSDLKKDGREWYFSEFLTSEFDIKSVNSSPDVLVYSIFGGTYNNSKYSECTKVFYSAENNGKNFERFDHCDYSISHHIPGEGSFGDHIEEESHLQMPIYVRVFGPDRMSNLKSEFDVEKKFKEKSKFCCLLTRHENAPVRNQIFKNIHNGYKEVDAAGNGWNNMGGWTVPGGWLDNKDFVKDYKFMIAVENTREPGYCSEKLYNAIRCETVPIYWGNPKVGELFNPNAFVNFDNFKSYRELVDYIKYLDNNNDAYKETLNADPFSCSVEKHPVYNEENIKSKTKMIFG